MPFEFIPIINTPNFGNVAAQKIYTNLKIYNQNDKEKLTKAKKQMYLKGFTVGVMLVGKHQGRNVMDIKPLI